MKKQKYFVSAICGILIVGGLTVCSIKAAQTANITYLAEWDGKEDSEITYKEIFKPYKQFGLAYNASKNELTYNGKLVRYFEDYYTIPDVGQVGNDFFNENGVVDVYAVRDLSSFVRSNDGSFDPSGKLVGIKEFTKEEFASRDVEALKNPPAQMTAENDEPISTKERQAVAKEYEAFDVTYDAKNDQWYLHDEKVRFFRDILTSNGESLTGGKFKGTMRTFESANGGTIDIYTVRDFANLNSSGNGTLTGIKKYSQQEFEEHTQSDKKVHSNSGICTVIKE